MGLVEIQSCFKETSVVSHFKNNRWNTVEDHVVYEIHETSKV